MKYLGAVLPLISLAFASYPAPAGPWTAAARKDASAGHIVAGAVQANGGKFWIGKDASTYCPSDTPEIDCSAYSGTQTVFSGGNNTVFLNVAVPGGQQVYVAPDGSLAYSTPHSAPPEGSVVSGFWREGSEGFMGAVFFGHNTTGTYACPTEEEGIYQVFFSDTTEGCYGFAVFTYTYSGIDNWEYL